MTAPVYLVRRSADPLIYGAFEDEDEAQSYAAERSANKATDEFGYFVQEVTPKASSKPPPMAPTFDSVTVEPMELVAYAPRLRVNLVEWSTDDSQERQINAAAESLEVRGYTVVGFQIETWVADNVIESCAWITYDIGPREGETDDDA